MRLLWITFALLLPCSGLLHAFGLGYYSPGAMILLIPLGLLGLCKSVVERTTPLWQILLLVFVAVYAASGAFHLVAGSIKRDYILTREAATILGTLCLLGISFLFRGTTTEDASRWLMIGVDFTLVVLLVETLSFKNMLPGAVKAGINLFFAGNETIRLQGPTQEASFVGAYLATLFPYALYNLTLARSARNIIRILSMAGFLLMILSLQGLLIWIAGIGAGLVYFMVRQSRRLAIGVACVAAVVLIGGGIVGTMMFAQSGEPEQPNSDKPNYVNSRLVKLRELDHPRDILFLDYSVFNRLSAPYYGLIAGVTQPLGVGPGGFGAFYSHRLSLINDARVQAFLAIRFLGDAEDTKSLVIQYIAEVGVLSLLFIAALVMCWRQRLLQAQRPEEKALAVALLAVFAIMAINAGSMLNLIFWICLVPLRAQSVHEGATYGYSHDQAA